MIASRTTPLMAERTKIDWSAIGRDPQCGRQLGQNRWQLRAHVGNDVQRRGVAGLLNTQQRRPLSVHAHDVGLRRKSVANVADVANVDGGAVDGLDRQIVQRRNRSGRAVGLDRVVDVAHLHIAGRQNDVLRVHGVDHIRRGKPVCLQFLGIDVDLHLALLAAVRKRQRGALHCRELGAHEVLPEVVQLLLGQAVAGESKLQHRHAGGTVLNDQRRIRSLRILAKRRLRDRGDLRDCLRDVDGWAEEYLDHGDAVQRLRLGVLDVIDRRGEAALVGQHDPVAQLLRATCPHSSR